MSLKTAFVAMRDSYVRRQAEAAKLPDFPDSPPERLRIRFSGRVQRVGFRLEVGVLAKRLGLTGYCRNLPGGDVEGEFQGTPERIRFLVDFMGSLKRIRIRDKRVTKLEYVPGEQDFIV